jgi:hypothetical protein
MLYLSEKIFVYRFYKILVIEPTTEVKAESIGAPSVKEIDLKHHHYHTSAITSAITASGELVPRKIRT